MIGMPRRMGRLSTEKLGTVGAFVVAIACPICFPKLALIGAALGFAAPAPLEGYFAIVVQLLALLALVGQALAFRRHRNRWLMALSVATTAALFAGFYVTPSSTLLQVALLGIGAASVWLVVEQRRCANCASARASLPTVAR